MLRMKMFFTLSPSNLYWLHVFCSYSLRIHAAKHRFPSIQRLHLSIYIEITNAQIFHLIRCLVSTTWQTNRIDNTPCVTRNETLHCPNGILPCTRCRCCWNSMIFPFLLHRSGCRYYHAVRGNRYVNRLFRLTWADLWPGEIHKYCQSTVWFNTKKKKRRPIEESLKVTP